MYIYQSRLLMLAFLITGYSGVANADTTPPAAASTTASQTSQTTASSTSQTNQATASSTSQTSQAANPETSQSNQAAPSPASKTSQVASSTEKSKQATTPKNKSNQSTRTDPTGLENKEVKKECVFKGVMADEDYQICGIKPPSETVHFKAPPKQRFTNGSRSRPQLK